MTARTELDLEKQISSLIEDDASENSYYFYDNEDSWWQLRRERNDVSNAKHNDLVDYLKQLLQWLYRLEGYQVNREINFYETDNPLEKPLYPDIFLMKTKEEFPAERGYRIGVDGPAPQVAIEVISKKTANTDLKVKPKRYEAWGITEYFAYDPRERKRKSNSPRLYGWRLVNGKYQELRPDELGRIWSKELDSWLVPDGEMLRLYDKDGNRRLTKAERLAERLRELGEDPDDL